MISLSRLYFRKTVELSGLLYVLSDADSPFRARRARGGRVEAYLWIGRSSYSSPRYQKRQKIYNDSLPILEFRVQVCDHIVGLQSLLKSFQTLDGAPADSGALKALVLLQIGTDTMVDYEA